MKSGLGKCKLGRKSIFTSWHKEYFENGAISEIRFPLMLTFYTIVSSWSRKQHFTFFLIGNYKQTAAE
jgi:hypothetical protein